MIKFIDLFCGIGGFRLAFESTNAECVFSAEIDKHACKTYQMNFGDDPFCDVSTLKISTIPDFNILCAGFPCQPFSIGGKREGFEDTRGTLFFDIARIIKAKKPQAFILENVRGLINHDHGKTFKVILETLEELDYKIFYKLLNSKDYGLPQNRERVYIIGFQNHKVKFNFPPPFKNSVDLSSIMEKELTNCDLSEITKFNIETHLKKHKSYEKIKDNKLLLAYEIRKSRCSFRFDDLSPCLTAKMGTGGNNVPIWVQKQRKFTTRECLRIQGFPESYQIEPNSSQSYKQIGNSVSVPVVRLLAKEMIKKLSEKQTFPTMLLQ